jgi:hypothetical protein
MSPRDTSTGGVLEAMILPALKRGGYTFQTQQKLTPRPGGRRHFVDVIAAKDGHRYLVSLKWQQTSGTAEQKVPFEVISLADAVRQRSIHQALSGHRWLEMDPERFLYRRWAQDASCRF